MERICEHTQHSELFATTLHLYALATHRNIAVDAIVVFPGLGETWRVQQAYTLAKLIDKPLLIAGIYQNERTFVDYAKVTFDVKTYSQSIAKNTPEQAVWTIELLHKLNIHKIALVVSPYHLYRAYATVLAQLIKLGLDDKILMFPHCVQHNPDSIIPETGSTAWDMVAGEYQRILTYQQKNDVASNIEVKHYISKLWQTLQ